MHTEHLQNVRAVRVLAGWLVAIAVTSLAALAAIGIPMLQDGVGDIGTLASIIAVAVGFWVGGFFTGFRALQAPILHGTAMGLTSLVAWVGVNLVASLLFPGVVWEELTPGLAVALLLIQIIAAVVGALMGYNVATRGKPGLSEHEPV
ncbi:MAG: hypothetical protein ACRELX_16430 [Longimicrobiales bacterium]